MKNTHSLHVLALNLGQMYDINVEDNQTNQLGFVIRRDRLLRSSMLTLPSYIAEILTKFSNTVPEKSLRYSIQTDFYRLNIIARQFYSQH